MKILLTAIISLYPVFVGQDVQVVNVELKSDKPLSIPAGAPIYLESSLVGKITSSEHNSASAELFLQQEPGKYEAMVTHVLNGERTVIVELFEKPGDFSDTLSIENSFEKFWLQGLS